MVKMLLVWKTCLLLLLGVYPALAKRRRIHIRTKNWRPGGKGLASPGLSSSTGMIASAKTHHRFLSIYFCFERLGSPTFAHDER